MQRAVLAEEAVEFGFEQGDALARVGELAREGNRARARRFELVELVVDLFVGVCELGLQPLDDLLELMDLREQRRDGRVAVRAAGAPGGELCGLGLVKVFSQ